MSSKQIVRLDAGSDQFFGVRPATLPQWIFAPARLEGLPTLGPTNGVGHRCLWKHPKSASGRTARSTTRACRDSASQLAPVEGTSTNTRTSVVSRETRVQDKCAKFLPPCWLWSRGATTSSDVHDSCLSISDVCAKSIFYLRDLEGSTGIIDTLSQDLCRTAAFSSGVFWHRDCFTICTIFDHLGTNVRGRASPILLSPSGDHVALVSGNFRRAVGPLGWEKWRAAHRPPRKQTWHIPFGVSELGGDVIGCALTPRLPLGARLDDIQASRLVKRAKKRTSGFFMWIRPSIGDSLMMPEARFTSLVDKRTDMVQVEMW